MRASIFVNSALACFLAILAISAYLLVDGNRNPRTATVIRLGERLPHLTLRDRDGRTHELPGERFGHLLIICGNGRELNASEFASVREIGERASRQVPLQAIAVMDGHLAPTLAGVEVEVLEDPQTRLWALTGMTPERPTLAIVDPMGILRYRVELPATFAADQADPFGLGQFAVASASRGRDSELPRGNQ